MRKWIAVGVATLVWVGTARAEMKLFAKYDWKNGAQDVAGGAIRHDGELGTTASIVGGKLVLNGWEGVTFDYMPEFKGAQQVMLRFEDVTFNKYSPDGDQASHYAALAGDGDLWWVGVAYTFRSETTTMMQVVQMGSGWGWATVSEDSTVGHFDSIEFKMDMTAPIGQRYGLRWNDGPWTFAEGYGEPIALPEAEHFRINDGGPSDWEPIFASLGTVSLYSDVVVPEPASLAVLAVVGMGLGMRRGRRA